VVVYDPQVKTSAPLSVAGLHAQARQHRIDFLKTDLDLCFTFCDLLETRLGMGDVQAAHDLKQKAERKYDTIARLLMRVEEGLEKDQIQQRLNELRALLDEFQSTEKISIPN
jgi:hypothetical protein